ncbi:MAG TPA: MBL fold metallo-hydrolase, partial [Saprospiraceae bacterium]|nr:MBL fold metallo-hydrolase [Saprospiraceae bacterium]
GHTEALMGLEFEYGGRTFWYTADLIPSSYHISLPFVMAYDVRPLLTLKEKEFVLNQMVSKNGILILEHDPLHDACTVKVNESKRIVLDEYVGIS